MKSGYVAYIWERFSETRRVERKAVEWPEKQILSTPVFVRTPRVFFLSRENLSKEQELENLKKQVHFIRERLEFIQKRTREFIQKTTSKHSRNNYSSSRGGEGHRFSVDKDILEWFQREGLYFIQKRSAFPYFLQ
ncbi:MAG: hypothetical protein AMS17_02705 [Spirochaetes bacterium DG_61]|nr:MAG: hypothetical protein AMS17_02705 [Spirochaetes bacterium DG_61]